MKQRSSTIRTGHFTNEVIVLFITFVLVMLALNIRTSNYVFNLIKSPIVSTLTDQTKNNAPCTAVNASTPLPCGVGGTWNLAFDDEFNGTTLNSSNWAKSWTTGSMNHVETDPKNVSVANGNLILSLPSNSDGALVTTNPKEVSPGFQFGTGYFVEARIYFPGIGQYVYNWPAFWAISGHSSPDGEIDIAEGTTALSTYYHSASKSNNIGTTPDIWTNGWHTYALDREPGVDYIYWDGKLVHTFKTDDGDTPDFIILNTGVQNSSAITGPQAQVKVDYVRAWSRSE